MSPKIPAPKPTAAGTTSGKPAARDPYEFRFVEMGEPSGGCDKDSRSIVRAHVMRDSYIKRKQRTHRESLPSLISAPPKSDNNSQQKFRFKLGPQGLQEVKKGRRRTKNVPPNDSLPVTIIASGNPQDQVAVYNPTSFPQKSVSPSTPHGKLTPKLVHSRDTSISDGLSASPVSQHSQVIAKPLSLPAIIGSGALDPFSTLPTLISPRTEILLFHAHRGVLSSRIMGRLRREWLQLATQDTAMFHIALSHYAGNYGLARHENDPVEALRFRMEAMSIMNQRLENFDKALTDGSIGTVASLSSYEATNGDTAVFQTHMEGLKELVKLRGGLQAGLNQYTRRLVLWADLNCANALGGTPVFELSEYTDLLPPSPATSPPADQQLEHPPPFEEIGNILSDLKLIDPSLVDLFMLLRDLAELDQGSPKSAEDFNAIRDSDKLLLAEVTLLALSKNPSSSKLLTSTCMAAIIFLDKHLRGITFNARIMERFVARLQVSMNDVLSIISPFEIDVKTARIMLWILYVGGVAAEEKIERAWFVTHLSYICDSLQLNNWKDAKQILESFLWPLEWETDRARLWEEVDRDRATTSQLLTEQDYLDNLALDLHPEAFWPIWTWDPHYVYRARVGVNRWQFLIDCQNDLSKSITKLNPNSKLFLMREAPQTLFPKLFKAWKITHLVFEKDTDAYARDRDAVVMEAAKEAGVEVIVRSGRTLWDSDELVKKNGGKPTMTISQVQTAGPKIGPVPKPIPTPTSIPDPGETALDFEQEAPEQAPDVNEKYRNEKEKSYSKIAGPNNDFAVPTLSELGFPPATTPHRGGETVALQSLSQTMSNTKYTATFQKPKTAPTDFSPQSTTLLSPHLHFGTLSVRQFYWAVQDVLSEYKGKASEPPTSLIGQLLFRDMYFGAQAALGHSFSHAAGNPKCRFIPWHPTSDSSTLTSSGPGSEAEAMLHRWTHGLTGFPWIDALMRQLRQEGWIHHLGRHAVACFLTRGGCYISWEAGAAVFAELLIDHEEACNIGNWQWLSCTAFFSQYYRCYSPIAFGKGWDKSGAFVRRYVPELKDMGDKWIYEPWKAPIADLKKAGVRIEGDGEGRGEGVYPKPMFDFPERRDFCLKQMKEAYTVGLYGDDPRVLDGSWEGLIEGAEAKDQKGTGIQKDGKRKAKGQPTLDALFKKAKT
ncbi:Cryptochrome-1 [Lachnellula suecica]|uniref:Cryptochrome-1 n=1 Tax=Lachnellula suecica TaxID=602035 RepID=A0A8T9CEE9_9HELO|nr:Cryptochrome-1 [Lachnellula suecica]